LAETENIVSAKVETYNRAPINTQFLIYDVSKALDSNEFNIGSAMHEAQQP
jgi:hypothetical protein